METGRRLVALKQVSLAMGFTALVLLGNPITAYAAPIWTTQWSTIAELYIDDIYVGITLKAHGNWTERQRTFKLDTNDPNYEAKVVALTSAYYAGHEILLEYDGVLDSWNTPITRFKVRP